MRRTDNKTLKGARFCTQAAAIAALYTALTLVSNALGLASGAIQLRISEALCVLPVFTTAAVPGLTLGCLLSNLLTGCHPLDIIFGSIATLIGAFGTRLLRNRRYLCCLPPIISNSLIVPFVIVHCYGWEKAFILVVLTVFAGELLSCYFPGLAIRSAIEKSGLQNRL